VFIPTFPAKVEFPAASISTIVTALLLERNLNTLPVVASVAP